jgi:TetR/AcrR family tetracycline transcriptional repressor
MRETAEVVLKIIAAEGVEAVTIRRLADELGVKAPSFYYHFRNRDEILAVAAKYAIERVRGWGDPTRPWREWIVDNACAYREALMAYPELVPTMLHRHLLHIGTDEQAVALLKKQGAPLHAILPIFDAIESFSAGYVLYTAAGTQENRPEELREKFPELVSAREVQGLTGDEVFRRAVTAIINALGGSE